MEILDTLDASVLDTVAAAPGETIVPHARTPTGALELLRELSSASPAASLQLRTGDVLGTGGMGVVRAAEQVALGRTVAVKTLKPDRRDQAAALDLLREAWVTGAIEHPNVVPVYYLGVDPDGSPLIVMKRVEGVEWSALIRDGKAVEQRFGATDLLAWNVGILMQVLNALRFAHHRGVIHRDVKPSNVMIGDFGEVYLLDWGIAVSLRDNGSGRLPLAKHATELAGTPCYMAPEMLGAEHGGGLSERTDIYLAGAVLFEIVAGAPPHTGTSALEVLSSVVESKPVVPAGVPAELARLCSDAMHADPAERVESAEAFRLALQRYLEHRGSAELSTRALVRLDELRAALAATPPDRDAVYRLFNACRFGFHEALAGWRDNADAKDGLARATIAVAEYELATDHPGAAVTLLGELDSPPPLLAQAKAAAAAREQRAAELEALRKKHDTNLGRRTRSFLMVVFGLLFSLIPVLLQLRVLDLGVTHASLLAWSSFAEILIIALAVWARRTLGATLFNRRLIASAMLNFVLQIVLLLAFWSTGVSIEVTYLVIEFLWATVASMLALTLDVGLAPSAIVYLAGFVVSARWPESKLIASAVSNFVMGMNGMIRWRPATIRLTPEERAWLDGNDVRP